MHNSNESINASIKALEETDNYLVIEKIKDLPLINSEINEKHHIAAIIDFETTGLQDDAEIIQIAIKKIAYRPDSTIIGAWETFEQFNEPKTPIPAEIVSITGITNNIVQGKSLNINEILEYVKNVNLFIAHHASFDRPHAEKIHSIFVNRPWACTLNQINWKDEGFDSSKLNYIAYAYKKFFKAHNAANDVSALASILSYKAPISGRPLLDILLTNARQKLVRVCAVDAPYHKKDIIKMRKKYYWTDKTDSLPKCWHALIPETDLEEEIEFLQKNIYNGQGNIITKAINLLDRFSKRE